MNILEFEMSENGLVMEWPWDEIECHAPNRSRLKRERQAYEEAERENREDG